MSIPKEQIKELREHLTAQPTETLKWKRHSLHQRKLTDGLIFPNLREQIDMIISLINEELRSRE
jgi:hypothetical protein